MKALTTLPSQRTFQANATLAVLLCAAAGALNAGGFFAVGLYTSHVTGHASRIADELVLGNAPVAGKYLALLLAYLGGAMASTFLMEHNLAQTHAVRYTKPLGLELVLVVAFALIGHFYDERDHQLVPYLAPLLSFAMGVQNAMVTKISGAIIRTTHMTGVTTDLGMEIVRLALLVRDQKSFKGLKKESQRAALHCVMLGSFVMGGIIGAYSFFKWGYYGALPVVGFLGTLVTVEIFLIRTQKTAGRTITQRLRRIDADRRISVRIPDPPAAPGASPAAAKTVSSGAHRSRT